MPTGTEEVVTELESRPEFETRVRQEAKQEALDLMEVWKAKELAALAEKQETSIREEVQKLVKEYQEKQKPLEAKDIQLMLEQEYAEVPLKLFVKVANDSSPQMRTFVVRELPQSVEKKFYKQFVERVKQQAPQLAAFTQRNMDQPFEKVLANFMEAFEGGFDILAGAVAIILDPYEEDAEVTPEWVANNVSSNRQYSIVMAQVEVNKLRDFFSRVFQSGQRAGTILNPRNSRSSLAL